MSLTNQEKRKAAKKLARRRRHVKHRNRLSGRFLKIKLNQMAKKLHKERLKNKPTDTVDGAEFYKQLKEKELQDKKAQNRGKGIGGFFQKVFRGAQRGQ